VPYPADLPEAERKTWLAQWRLTPAGETYRRRSRGFSHRIALQPDGSFRVDEVQPGSYVLHVRGPFFAKFSREISIPEPAAGQRTTPVDLGSLALKP
jgi:hypothetical protein